MKKIALLFAYVVLVLASGSDAEVILSEDFSADPAERGWTFTSVDPFVSPPDTQPPVTWNPVEGDLAVTWDPSKPTGFYQIRLPRLISEKDAFRLEFEIQLSTVRAEHHIQIGLGLRRGTYAQFDRTGGPFPPGDKCRDLFELAYFPKVDPIWGGPWLQPTICTSAGQFRSNFTHPSRALPLERNIRVTLHYDPATRSVSMDVVIDSEAAIIASPEAQLSPDDSFNVDTFGIFFYGDVPDADPSTDLVLGTIDNIRLEVDIPSFSDDFGLYR